MLPARIDSPTATPYINTCYGKPLFLSAKISKISVKVNLNYITEIPLKSVKPVEKHLI